MPIITKKHMKYALATIGALYAVGFTVYIGYSFLHKEPEDDSADLALHPERAGEIMAAKRAQEMKDRLKLSDEQAQQIAAIMQKGQQDNGQGDPRGRWRGLQDEIAKVLTPEQQALADQARGQMRGNNMTPERVQALEENMSPDLKARFDARLQERQQRRAQFGGRRGGAGPGGPPPAPPDASPPADTPAAPAQ